MADESTPPLAEPAPAPARRRRLGRWLGGALVGIVVVAGGLVGALFWALHHPAGSAWLATMVPHVDIVGPRGTLLGDFSAERIEVTLPGSAGVLRLEAARWQALDASRGDHGRWLHLTMDTLHADRVTILRSTTPVPATHEPATPPRSLRLPVEIEVRAMSIDELRLGDARDAPTLRPVLARVHLGADGGATHRFDNVASGYERAGAAGSASIGADAPFQADLRLALASTGGAAQWHANIAAAGPLEALNAKATAQVSGSVGRTAQSLAAEVTLRPFAAWPLGALRLETAALDLSAFSSAAPATALSGHAVVASTGIDRPAIVSIDLRNDRAGRWNEALLPVRSLKGELRARPDAPNVLEVQSLAADLGSAKVDGGRVAVTGRWTADAWTFDADLERVRPAALDARAPETTLGGKLGAAGSGFAATKPDAWTVDVAADLSGALADQRLPRAAPRQAHVQGTARFSGLEIDLRSVQARLGGAEATLAARLVRKSTVGPWHAKGQAVLVDFDPAPWWPGDAGGLWSRGANRLNAKGDFDVDLPAADASSAFGRLAATRGQADLSMSDSTLAGVPLRGTARFVNSDGNAQPTLDVVAGANRLHVDGRVAAAADKRDDWHVAVDAPDLGSLAPLLRGRGGAPSLPALAGALSLTGRIEGRWPELRSDGELRGAKLRFEALAARRADATWRVSSSADAPLEARLSLDGVAVSGHQVERVEGRVSGTARAHTAQLRLESNALPPAWAEAFAQRAGASAGEASGASSSAGTAPAAIPKSDARSSVVVALEGGLVDANGARAAGWRGTLHELIVQSTAVPTDTWLSARELHGGVYWAGGPIRASLEPGGADVLGAKAHWSRIAWQAADAAGAGARLDVQATIDPLSVAPALRALQPDFGWGGNLAVGARIDVHGAPGVTADVVVERAHGDLSVTDEYGTQNLGFSDLRFGIAAKDGVWHFTTALAGSALGVASGALTARTGSNAAWPGSDTPVQGVLELRVANLGTWGRWLPAGWRLGGEIHANASIAGRFGAPEYTGHVDGANIGVRNFLQGVNVTDGSIAIALQGSSARIERFTAKGGAGTIGLAGEASFGTAPSAHLDVTADRFEMLGRVDRRIVTSGKAALRLDAKSLGLDGEFRIDEGLVDFTRSDAPTLGDDVEVVRRPAVAGSTVNGGATASAPVAIVPAPSRQVALDLRVAMGEKLRVRGRGLDAGLRGELRLTSPGGRLAVDGSLRAVDGTYQAYGQRLGIDRGVLTFVGPVENPRLDIEATRPNLDVRVGVVVAGTALNPRIRLFSEPDMTDIDKLSWLVLGRASEGVGANDTALLQSAALALLSGEGPGLTDRLTHAIGLDTVGVRQQSTGDVKETIVTLGKQLSKRWYVGYERGLNTTAGSWQLIYRIAQRLTVRAQAGGDNSLDLIWTLRWK